jgi:hypothetical protein
MSLHFNSDQIKFMFAIVFPGEGGRGGHDALETGAALRRLRGQYN